MVSYKDRENLVADGVGRKIGGRQELTVWDRNFRLGIGTDDSGQELPARDRNLRLGTETA